MCAPISAALKIFLLRLNDKRSKSQNLSSSSSTSSSSSSSICDSQALGEMAMHKKLN
jgi:hypothetical protein